MSKKRNQSFELNDKEQDNLDKILKAYKTMYPDQEYGIIEYRFTPTGIGNGVTVYFKSIDKEYDITDIESW
jgi:hypothetical protein